MTRSTELEKSVAHFVGAATRPALATLWRWIALPARAARGRGTGWSILPPIRWIAVCSVGAIIAVAAAMAFVDAWAIDQTRLLPPWLIDAFNRITDLGQSGWFLVPTGILVIWLAVLARPALGRMTNLMLIAIAVRLEFIFLAVAAPGLVFTVLKRLIGRARPPDLGAFHYVPFSWRPELASMPSGHATTAFSAAIAIGALFPRARPVLWIYAAVIALSRVVISTHFPSDVVAGAFVGGFGALVVRNWFAARRLAFTVGADHAVRPWPGPSRQRLKRVARRVLAD
jgi:membrane-associated phospholipid phosphatase